MVALLTVVAATLIDQVTSESNRSIAAVKSDAVDQAAEAGVNDYIAKLLDDPQYYNHYVANGEATRTSCTSYSAGVCNAWGSLVISPVANGQKAQAWTPGTHWGYHNASATNNMDNWFQGTGNAYSNSTVLKGYAYDLMITPPSSTLGTNYVTILSTGCKLVSGGTTCDSSVPMQSIEVRVRKTTPADFQFMWPGNVSYGSDATTYGTIYAAGTISHQGTAYGNLESETSVTGSPTLLNGAKIYTTVSTNPSIRTVVTSPIFTSGTLSSNSYFAVSLTDVKRAAGQNVPSTDFEDSTASAWRFNFSQNGTVQVWRCVNSSTPQTTQPYCNDIALSSGVTLKSNSSTTMTVNGNTDSFPSSGTLYIGPSSSVTTAVTYTGTTTTSTSGTFTGVKCSSCGSTGTTFSAGTVVSVRLGRAVQPRPRIQRTDSGERRLLHRPGRDHLLAERDYRLDQRRLEHSQRQRDRRHEPGRGDRRRHLLQLRPGARWGPERRRARTDRQQRRLDGLVVPRWNTKRAIRVARSLDRAHGHLVVRRVVLDDRHRANGSTLLFIGSSTAQTAGCASDFDNRSYVSDDGSYSSTFDALQTLFPPWYPVINGMETTMLFEAVPTNTQIPVG